MADLAAFFSYAHADDHDGGITRLHEALANEAGMQLGDVFRIFLDRKDIAWGDNWRRRIESSLDSVTLLIPLITPRFFASEECRRELERFLDREERLGRDDLVWPIYYVDAAPMNEPGDDALAVALASRQYADWRELRVEPLTSPTARRRLEILARAIRDSTQSAPQPVAPTPSSNATPASGATQSTSQGHTPPPTRVVDPYGRGDHTTIGEAIAAAAGGDRILVRPGLYDEALFVDKPLEIVGHGDLSEIVVRADGDSVLRFATNIGRVSNLTLQQGAGDFYCVDISQGRFELEGCDITSRSLACVAVRGGADPRVRHNRIHGGAAGGVFVIEQSLGTFEDNDIFGHALSGIEVIEAATPTFRRNTIRENTENGILADAGGLGTIDENDIFENGKAGIEVRGNAKLTVRRNRIHANVYEAIWIYKGGGGTFEDNDLTDNTAGAWAINDDAGDVVRRGNEE